MYLDTDVVLALLKVEDWLKSAVDLDAMEEPVTSTATVLLAVGSKRYAGKG